MNEELSNFLEDFTDLLNGFEASIVKMREQIGKLEGVRVWSWNPEKVKWLEAEGERGKYEKSEDVNNLDFKAMLKDVAAHNGKLKRDRYFYWVFQNGTTVGRKLQKVS